MTQQDDDWVPFSSPTGGLAYYRRRSISAETLADWKQSIDTELKRAELLQDAGLFTPEMQDALERRIELWKAAVESHIKQGGGR